MDIKELIKALTIKEDFISVEAKQDNTWGDIVRRELAKLGLHINPNEKDFTLPIADLIDFADAIYQMGFEDGANSEMKESVNETTREDYRAMSLNLAKKVAKNAPKAEKQAPAAFEVYAGPYSYHILLPYNYTDRERRNAEEYARLMGIPYDEIRISAFVGNKKDYADEDAVIIYPSGRVSDLKGNTIKLESAQKNEDSYVESIKEQYIEFPQWSNEEL